MGSKNKILPDIWLQIRDLDFESVYDAFAGSNVVSYFLKCQGKKVITNDFLAFSHITSRAIIENSTDTLDENDVNFLLTENKNDGFIERTFRNIFYNDEENQFLDRVRYNITLLETQYEQALALSALVRACVKKRSRGIFTFVGERYNDGRLDMQKSIEEHFIESIKIFNDAVFDNEKGNWSYNEHTEALEVTADLVYLDPPYFSPTSDNDYVRRYHFVEGLVKDWKDITIQEHSVVKKFKSYVSPFSKRETAYSAFENLFKKHQNSIIVVSYSSNSFPTKDELAEMLRKYKSSVDIHEIDHTYSFGNQKHKSGNLNNRVKEYVFIGK